jgi:hydroxypyruvate isomerase
MLFFFVAGPRLPRRVHEHSCRVSLFSIHLGYVLGSLPFAERFSRARELGFRAVEFPFPYAVPAADYAEHLNRHGLKQISIGAPTTDYRKGEPGYAVDPRQRAAFVHSLEAAADYAQQIGCAAVHIFSGCACPDLSEETMQETYGDNLRLAAGFLAERGIATLIEPINATDFSGYYLNTLTAATDFIAKVDPINIRLIFDIYHVRMMQEDPLKALRAVHRQVQHVQFADFPGRHEPGTGALDFSALTAFMRSVFYAGTAGLEYIPTRPIVEPLHLPQALLDFANLEPISG